MYNLPNLYGNMRRGASNVSCDITGAAYTSNLSGLTLILTLMGLSKIATDRLILPTTSGINEMMYVPSLLSLTFGFS